MELDFSPVTPRDGMELPGAGEESWDTNTFPKQLDPSFIPRPENVVENYHVNVSSNHPILNSPILNPVIFAPYNEFWLDNPFEILSEPYIFPTQNMTLNQKLNSMVRGGLFASLALYLFSNNRKTFIILIFAVLLSIFLFYSNDMCTKIHQREYIIRERKMKHIQDSIKCAGMQSKEILSDSDLIVILTHPDAPKLNEIMKSKDAKNIIQDAIPKEKMEAVIAKNPKPQSIIKNAMANAKSAAEAKAEAAIFDIPEDYNWNKDNAHEYDQRLFRGIDQNVEEQTRGRNEILLTYGDMLDTDFENVLTQDFHGEQMEWFREENPWFVDRDVHNPWMHNEDEYKYDEW